MVRHLDIPGASQNASQLELAQATNENAVHNIDEHIYYTSFIINHFMALKTFLTKPRVGDGTPPPPPRNC